MPIHSGHYDFEWSRVEGDTYGVNARTIEESDELVIVTAVDPLASEGHRLQLAIALTQDATRVMFVVHRPEIPAADEVPLNFGRSSSAYVAEKSRIRP